MNDDNVIIGNRQVNGSRNVIIDATDLNGNTILNRPMIIGHNAKGGPNDIVIGAGAQSNTDIFSLLNKLADVSDPEVAQKIVLLVSELKSGTKDKNKIRKLWNLVQNAVVLADAAVYLSQIGVLIGPYIL